MYKSKNPLILVISGKAESGKDYLCDKIVEYFHDKKVKKVAYAYYIKEYLKQVTDWDGNPETKPRAAMQDFTVNFLNIIFDEYFLVNRVLEDVKVYSYFFDVILITDARLVREIEEPKKRFKNVHTIRIERVHHENKLSTKEKQHITETGLDGYDKFDYTIINEGQDLMKEIDKIMEEIL